ncbi:FecR family protein [Carboxylicivirga sp. RSCT41]|uniref:FecR family protein n=1 Tax=Carboxylicivirga agarovorans TaxID=3417570 RepID=UPI003D35373C
MKDENDYRTLLVRFFEKRISDAETDKLKEWINASDNNRKVFDEFNESYQYADILAKGWLFNPEDNWDGLKQRIQKSGQPPVYSLPSSHKLTWWRSVAVVAILFALSSIVWNIHNSSKIPFHDQSVKMITPPGQKSQVILQDGTKVWLNSGSELDYAFEPDKQQRIATLKGEAFFEVSSDSMRPFIVNTSEVIMKVYGTRFNVRAYDNAGTIQTSLEEGSVGMQIIATGEEKRIIPGQQITYRKKTRAMIIGEVNVDLIAPWKHNVLQFEDDTFYEVVKKLEQWYGVTIKLDKSLEYKGRYTMTIKNETINEVLELIQITTPIRYEIMDDQIMIMQER